jgi:hypothetical protein
MVASSRNYTPRLKKSLGEKYSIVYLFVFL